MYYVGKMSPRTGSFPMNTVYSLFITIQTGKTGQFQFLSTNFENSFLLVTNVGYVCLDNDSNIVEDVSDVFPVFFFLIAALVCMTTMNRMIEEQRTQIGILKVSGRDGWQKSDGDHES